MKDEKKELSITIRDQVKKNKKETNPPRMEKQIRGNTFGMKIWQGCPVAAGLLIGSG